MRKSKRRRAVDTIPPADPNDPVQQLDAADALGSDGLAVEAEPAAEAQAGLDEAVAAAPDEPEVVTKDTGDLYGVYTPRAADRAPAAQDSTLGETWLESLDQRSTEGGPLPEHDVAVIDDSDDGHRPHHSTESGDRPVADKGSGGRGGL